MKRFIFGILIFLMCAGGATGQSIPVSQDTESCIECHASLHPGIVAEWKKSRHALITPEEALKRPSLSGVADSLAVKGIRKFTPLVNDDQFQRP